MSTVNWYSLAPQSGAIPETETGPSQGARPEGKENTRTDKDHRGIREEAYPPVTESTPLPATSMANAASDYRQESPAPAWYNDTPGIPADLYDDFDKPVFSPQENASDQPVSIPPMPGYAPTAHEKENAGKLETGLVARVRERMMRTRPVVVAQQIKETSDTAREEARQSVRESYRDFEEKHPRLAHPGFSHQTARRFLVQGLTMWVVSPTTGMALADRVAALWEKDRFAQRKPLDWDLISGPATWLNRAFELYVQNGQIQELITLLALAGIPVVVTEVWRSKMRNEAMRWILRTPLAGFVTAIVFYTATVGTK